MYKPNSKWTWSFFLASLAQAAVALALEGYVFGKFQASLKGDAESTQQSRTIPTYLAVFMFGYIYQLVLVWDALRAKNTIQVIGLCFYNVGILIYAAIQLDQIKDAARFLDGRNEISHGFWHDVNAILIALPCLMAFGTVVLSFIAWKLYDEFAWTIYKHISADLRLKRRYLTYQIYIALLKFDFFFFLGFTVQFLVVVHNTSNAEYYLTIVALPVTFVLLVLAAYITRKESFFGMICIIIVYFAALAYFVFKLVRMYAADYNRVQDYLPARRTLTSFAVITILLLMVTIIIACWCTHNFNKGLKPHITKGKPTANADGGKVYTTEMPALSGPVPGRMTID
ncbi:hypothetical protein K432DRAFT_122900 [Lepidopterella palustris CBS 459.81]|uniref:Uncharacterized protein n=1 Tax=Lepidopterella palustris CBS 459.81 TaxID=1314670 RepID=A0A8E2E4T3_9PEZI|nr:hypothetical protein K432DRAFT_122900 [Lepidopterella palustris CBS 459.81]